MSTHVTPMAERLYLIIPPLLTMSLITALSVIPSAVGEEWFPHEDKIFHGIAYAVLCYVYYRTFRYRKRSGQSAARWSLALAASFGIVIEIVQAYLPLREFDWFDMIANSAGAAMVLIVSPAIFQLDQQIFQRYQALQ